MDIKQILQNIKVFIKWVIIAVVVGGILGLVGTAFHFLVEYATEYRMHNSKIIWLLPVAGLVIVFLYERANMLGGKGTNLILMTIRTESDKPHLVTAPLIFSTTIITHLFGGSAGREGAALQLGGSIAGYIGEKIGLEQKDITIITMCGMSGAFAALFGTPLTSAIFSMEVISVGIMYYSAIVPCVISAVIGSEIAKAFGIAPTFFMVDFIPAIDMFTVGKVIILGGLCAIVSYIFCTALHTSSNLYAKYFKNPYIKIVVAGVLVSVFTFVIGTTDYNGAGMDVIGRAITNGEVKPLAFILKIILTALTLGAGYKGGEIVPAFFVGATFGAFAAQFLGLPVGFGGALGLIGVFCAATNCPLTSTIISIELFGVDGLIYFAIIAGVSYMLSGYHGLYSAQKIMYSKFKAEYINKDIM